VQTDRRVESRATPVLVLMAALLPAAGAYASTANQAPLP